MNYLNKIIYNQNFYDIFSFCFNKSLYISLVFLFANYLLAIFAFSNGFIPSLDHDMYLKLSFVVLSFTFFYIL